MLNRVERVKHDTSKLMYHSVSYLACSICEALLTAPLVKMSRSVVKSLQEATGKQGIFDIIKKAGVNIILDGNWMETSAQLSGGAQTKLVGTDDQGNKYYEDTTRMYECADPDLPACACRSAFRWRHAVYSVDHKMKRCRPAYARLGSQAFCCYMAKPYVSMNILLLVVSNMPLIFCAGMAGTGGWFTKNWESTTPALYIRIGMHGCTVSMKGHRSKLHQPSISLI